MMQRALGTAWERGEEEEAEEEEEEETRGHLSGGSVSIYDIDFLRPSIALRIMRRRK